MVSCGFVVRVRYGRQVAVLVIAIGCCKAKKRAVVRFAVQSLLLLVGGFRFHLAKIVIGIIGLAAPGAGQQFSFAGYVPVAVIGIAGLAASVMGY